MKFRVQFVKILMQRIYGKFEKFLGTIARFFRSLEKSLKKS